MTDHNNLVHGDLTGRILAAAMEVHREMRNGLDEKIYENSLCVEFDIRGIGFDQQKSFPVHYKGHRVGNLIPDLIVEEKIIVDTKVVECFVDAHISQMISYLKITGLQVGLLINFKKASLEWRRVTCSS